MRIITIGLAPAWDVSYRGGGVDWERHAQVESRAARPAGKALNVSRALGWMGHRNIAAGLWGAEDYEQMRRALREAGERVQVRMTVVEGQTRQNITVVDTARWREMHLRCASELATGASLRKLKGDLARLVRQGDICVFAGAMPEGDLLEAVIGVAETCRRRGARIVVDTHGAALRGLVEHVKPWLISPNLEELAELLGGPAKDAASSLARAGRQLLDKVENVLISRGKKGAVLVTRDGAWVGQAVKIDKVTQTVGCGDYLLAGFLAGLGGQGRFDSALTAGLKAATAHAYGWTESMSWESVRRKVKVEVEKV